MTEPNRDTLEQTKQDPDHAKGAVSSDRPEQTDNTASMTQQIDHRDQRSIKKDQDTDFPEPGNNPEYSMQKSDGKKIDKDGERVNPDSKLHPSNDPDGNAGASVEPKEANGNIADPKPDDSQKSNQNDKKDDDLAA